MTPYAGPAPMNSDEKQRLLDASERFETDWQKVSGRDVSIDLSEYLPPSADPLRSTVLHELIKTDLEIRYRRGLGVTLEFYLKRFPELGATRTLSHRLIYEEYRVRQLYGDKPDLASYQA